MVKSKLVKWLEHCSKIYMYSELTHTVAIRVCQLQKNGFTKAQTSFLKTIVPNKRHLCNPWQQQW